MKLGEKTYLIGGHSITIKPAHPTDVLKVIMQDDEGDNGRSEWLWVTLPNGDLILGTYPQGNTYEIVVNGEHFDD